MDYSLRSCSTFESASTITRNVCRHQVGICGVGSKKGGTPSWMQSKFLGGLSTYVFVTKCNQAVTSIVTADNLGKARNGQNGVTLGVKW